MRRFLALIALLALSAGPPVVLAAWGFTDWGAIHLWSATDVRVLLAVLTAIAWLAWGAWMMSVVVEVWAALPGRRIRVRLPGLSLPRALASALVATIMASGAASAHAAPPTPAHPASVLAVGEVGAASGPEAAGDPVPAPDTTGPTHTVVPGDELWSLAQRYYGEGTRWRTIVEANPTLHDDPLRRLVPGTVLSIPDPVGLVTVRQGDTLSAIAAEHLGDPDRWPEVHALNAGRITDPDLIRPGWVLKVPLVLQPAPTVAAPTVPAPTVPAPAGSSAPTGSPAPTTPPAGPAATDLAAIEALAPAAEAAPAVGLLGGMTALSAAAVIGGVGLRRRLKEHQRPLGRRYVQPDSDLARYEVALTHVAAPGPDRSGLLGRAMRLLSQHWWAQGRPAAPVARVLVGPDGLTFVFESEAPPAPEHFDTVDRGLTVSWAALADLEDPDHPVAYPALVTLGESEPGQVVMVDALRSGVLGVRDAEDDSTAELLSAMLVELACSPWSEELGLLVVTRDPHFAAAMGEGRIACERDVDRGVATVERLVSERSRLIGTRGWDHVRLDPDLAEAWSAQLVLFEVAPDAAQLARLEAAIAQHPCGVAAVAPVPAPVGASVDREPGRDGAGRRTDTHLEFVPPRFPAHARAALADLYELASDPTTGPAPWWRATREEEVNIIALRPLPGPLPAAPRGPRLNLLGPVELVGCAGAPPPRAVRQCVEYCAWLHLHPGGSPVQMANALLVAEGTRRSNMSRLRSWLGARPDGALYLPDAYSGRIMLHDDVTSDWDDLSLLVVGGVNRAPLERLMAALDLVRGAPLADAAPGQWGWAEEFRSDAAALIRDIGVVAAREARARGDLEGSRWAANRALAAAPDDELLLGERIRTEHAAGRSDEVARLVDRVVRTARRLGADLLPETVDMLQEVIEGRRRALA